jgi:hypothetical protein
LAVLVQPAAAEYYNFNTQSGSDILYQEIRYPYWPESTYNARYYNYVQDDFGRSVFFYSGTVINASPSGSTGTRNNGYIWSFWPVTNPLNSGDSVTPLWWNPPFYDVPSVGEGASGKVEAGDVRSMTTNVWYPSALRVWRPAGNPENVAHVGQWLKDGVTGKWSHIATMNVPFAATKFNGTMSGFLEDFSNGNANPRRAEFRNIYYRKNTWQAATTFKPSTRQAAEKGTSGLMENNTVGFFETCSGASYTGNMGPGAVEMTYTLATPPTPTFDAPVVNNVTAVATANQVHVKWNVPDTSSPQFAWKVELFATADTSGAPAMTVSKIDPDVRECVISTAGLPAPTVRLTITDIFDQSSTAAALAATTATLANATDISGTVPGLGYKYYETSLSALPNFASLAGSSLKLQGAVNLPDLTVRQKHTSYACLFTGYVNVPADGLWLFSLASCDGSKLLINGNTVINNDGVHSGGSELTGTVALKAGKHPVEIQYFKNSSTSGDNDQLKLSWEGPGVARTVMAENCWFRSPASTEPSVALTSPAPGTTVDADAAAMTATVAANGNTLSSARFFNRDTIYASQNGTSSPISTTALLGAGPNRLKARLMCSRSGVNYSFDSPPVDVTATQPDESPWTFSALGLRSFQSAAAYNNGTWSMIGDQFNFVWQQIAGDETIVTRVAGKPSTGTGNSSQFDAVGFDGSWSGGVMFRENLSANPGIEFGNRFVCLYKQVNNGVYLQSSDDVNPGGYVTGPNLGSSYTWLKLQRAGTTFTASGSTNGTTWTELGTRTMATPFSQKMYVGLFTLARPSTNPNPHWFKFDNTSFASIGAGFQISGHPQSRSVYAGAAVTFSATIASSTPLSYQWQRNGADIPGATAATYTLDPVQASDAADYRVIVSNGTTTTPSNAATLAVKASGTGYQRAVEIQGPLAYWRLNETTGTTVTDSVGAYHGTTVGSLTLGQPGPRPAAYPAFAPTNNAFVFNGSGSRVEVPALNLHSNTVTMSAWIKRNGTQASFAGILFSRAGNTVAGLTFGNSNELRYTWNDSGGTYGWNSGLTPPDGVWTFVALTIEPSKATIYMNPGTGLVSATNGISHAIEEFDGKFCIGQDTTSSTRTFRGTIDEVALFDRSLSAAELAQMSDPPAAVTIAATIPTAKEQGPVSGLFTITRADAATTAALTVNLSISGTATPGSDYTAIPATVTIPAGASSTTVAVLPVTDAIAEGPETAILTAASGTGYYVSSPSSGTVTIEDLPADNWRFAKFGAAANTPSISGDDADPDRDGITNLMEFALNANPQASDSALLPAVSKSGGTLSLTYRKNVAATDVTYTVLQSDDVAGWTPATVTEQILSDDGSTRVIKASITTGSATEKFLRLKVTRP